MNIGAVQLDGFESQASAGQKRQQRQLDIHVPQTQHILLRGPFRVTQTNVFNAKPRRERVQLKTNIAVQVNRAPQAFLDLTCYGISRGLQLQEGIQHQGEREQRTQQGNGDESKAQGDSPQ